MPRPPTGVQQEGVWEEGRARLILAVEEEGHALFLGGGALLNGGAFLGGGEEASGGEEGEAGSASSGGQVQPLRGRRQVLLPVYLGWCELRRQ